MGSSPSKPMTSTEEPYSTSTEATHAGIPDCPIALEKIYPYLLMAFVAGVLLTLLVTAIIFVIKKSCSKHPTSGSQAIPLASDPSHTCCPTAEEALTCADMSLKDSGENRVCFTQNQHEELDPIVYAQIKVQTKTSLPISGSGEMR
ncbi:transmembrane protein C1orf162 homolog [Vombatus ursinus]|uniref:transmembrane protein C1orf162 homolog n=1 Tax=Vombatus ursinus TaxID=29139 RepID=UPI000FFCFE64|nr:transmembrane protein C1orf162 homolog [Vombatus ursinus]XP_027716162.1 transmembrane protein C1orf162 homolog [Vombatus ursinus]